MSMDASNEIQTLYRRLLNALNEQSARGMAELFAEEGEMIGFDGSQAVGPEEIFSHLDPIFCSHPTARFVSKIKSVRLLGADAAILRAIAGMVPRGQEDLNSDANTHHTLAAIYHEGTWQIRLFQNTPAQFHGRPHLVQQMTEELRALLK